MTDYSPETQRLARKLRNSLMATARDALTKRKGPVAVPLSGGVDSHCALFTLLALGQAPTAFSFRMQDRPPSRDWRVAKATAAEFGVPFVDVVLPSSLDTLVRDVGAMATFGSVSKVDFECYWPMRYLINAAFKRKMKFIFTGHGADSLYCMSRKASQHFKGREDEFRQQAFSNPKAFQRHLLTKQCGHAGIEYVPVFYTTSMLKAFTGATHDVLHKPIEKAPSRAAFADDFERVRVYTHQSFQLGDSGIQEHFQRLLATSLNPDGRYKSTTGVFNTLVRNRSPGSTLKGLFR